MTIVVVGGGPTGVELAGAFAELAQHVLREDFQRIDPGQARVILIEGGPRVLEQLSPAFPPAPKAVEDPGGAGANGQHEVRNISEGRVDLETARRSAPKHHLGGRGRGLAGDANAGRAT